MVLTTPGPPRAPRVDRYNLFFDFQTFSSGRPKEATPHTSAGTAGLPFPLGNVSGRERNPFHVEQSNCADVAFHVEQGGVAIRSLADSRSHPGIGISESARLALESRSVTTVPLMEMTLPTLFSVAKAS